MTDQQNTDAKKLNTLYHKTYPGTYSINLSEISQISIDGQDFMVGIYRHKDNEDTEMGRYAPHTRSDSTTFLARLKDGELTGDSIRIKASAVEDRNYNISKNLHRTTDELLSTDKGYTFIEVDKNKAAELPRYERHSDGSLHGRTFADHSTIIDGFYNVIDRAQILEALQHSPKRKSDAANHKTIREFCTTAIKPNAEDAAQRTTEAARQQAKAAQTARQENIERSQALRDFIQKNPASNNPAAKFTRKLKAKRHIEQYKKQQQDTKKRDIETKKNFQALREILSGR